MPINHLYVRIALAFVNHKKIMAYNSSTSCPNKERNLNLQDVKRVVIAFVEAESVKMFYLKMKTLK